jgi:hypothetical protein
LRLTKVADFTTDRRGILRNHAVPNAWLVDELWVSWAAVFGFKYKPLTAGRRFAATNWAVGTKPPRSLMIGPRRVFSFAEIRVCSLTKVSWVMTPASAQIQTLLDQQEDMNHLTGIEQSEGNRRRLEVRLPGRWGGVTRSDDISCFVSKQGWQVETGKLLTPGR